MILVMMFLCMMCWFSLPYIHNFVTNTKIQINHIPVHMPFTAEQMDPYSLIR